MLRSVERKTQKAVFPRIDIEKLFENKWIYLAQLQRLKYPYSLSVPIDPKYTSQAFIQPRYTSSSSRTSPLGPTMIIFVEPNQTVDAPADVIQKWMDQLVNQAKAFNYDVYPGYFILKGGSATRGSALKRVQTAVQIAKIIRKWSQEGTEMSRQQQYVILQPQFKSLHHELRIYFEIPKYIERRDRSQLRRLLTMHRQHGLMMVSRCADCVGFTVVCLMIVPSYQWQSRIRWTMRRMRTHSRC